MSAILDHESTNSLESHHDMQLLSDIISEVATLIAPVWPLRDYVAVSPYAGIIDRSFLDARTYMRRFSDYESLMPIEHYSSEFQRGSFSASDIEAALSELSINRETQDLSATHIVEELKAVGSIAIQQKQFKTRSNRGRVIRTIAEYATKKRGINWTEVIVEELSKYCSAHYDQGQAAWTSPHSNQTLYQAWRNLAAHDRNIEILGVAGMRSTIADLPHSPEAAILHSLNKLGVPSHLWSSFLASQLFSIPGWSAWTKYQSHWADGPAGENNDFVGLLAMRLAYDAALAEAKSLQLNWLSLVGVDTKSCETPSAVLGDDAIVRYILLRASEIAYRNQLLASLANGEAKATTTQDRKLAQMVFCIDVRSERVRRHLESQSTDIETFGFAGFFGVGFNYLSLGNESRTSQLPVLLKPSFRLHEGMREGNSCREAAAISQQRQFRNWGSLWKSFQSSAVSCFSFVETSGLSYGIKLLRRSVGFAFPSFDSTRDGLSQEDSVKLGPTLRGLNEQGLTTSRQTDLAEGLLRNLGLTTNFARLIVFCGHTCQTENNPVAAGLDCGACGGHSGEPNARFAALLLNQLYIRQALRERGITIPEETYFVGALHNTTTDVISFFDTHTVPRRLLRDLEELKGHCATAGEQTRTERLPLVASHSPSDLFRRARDWSEVRPEWGLAGNAVFIVAPRALTAQVNLQGRSFLHSYDYKLDEGGNVLETIMTAPMIVANWINMQYFASTVDPHHFGSGDKTVHNVVGKFGILSGNGGDLQTGLPWQSLHTGQRYQHLPMRLQVVIAAPREMIDRIVAKHEVVANLVVGQWLHLIAMDGEQFYEYCAEGSWKQLNETRTGEQA
jgi:uncharacterized protein YbcC (UPF0753/DUF2309 family)